MKLAQVGQYCKSCKFIVGNQFWHEFTHFWEVLVNKNKYMPGKDTGGKEHNEA